DIVAGWKVLTESDARIKKVQGISDGAQDLLTLSSIEITDYTMKDHIRSGNTQYKKVIAQQVESVYPLAVGTTTNFIPNVYDFAQIEDGRLNIGIKVKVNDELKLIIDGQHETIAKVISIEDELAVLDIDYTGEIFVYGKRVNDFKVVDYDALSMLNVSATQELFKRMMELENLSERLQTENASLKADVSQLKSMSADIELLKEAMGIDLKASK
ncbi:MAG: hypothetical protein QF371_07790, partial [Flavobacteriales bacterium]|nr:hypothetical protein [Flavobacteriales bacterium]